MSQQFDPNDPILRDRNARVNYDPPKPEIRKQPPPPWVQVVFAGAAFVIVLLLVIFVIVLLLSGIGSVASGLW